MTEIDPTVAVYADRLNRLHKRMKEVHKADLHIGQRQMARAYFHDKKKVIISQWGRNGGKLLPLDTLIPTPDRGFVPMGELQPGDWIFGSDGKPYQVTYCSPIEMEPELYRIKFSDGSFLEACKDHRWETTTKLTRRSIKKNKGKFPNRSPLQSPKIVTTEEIKSTLKHGKEWNHSILCCLPVESPHKNLSLDPYVLGAWLGDGHSNSPSMTGIDIQILNEFEKAGFKITKRKDPQSFGIVGLLPYLRELFLLNNKHVPYDYLWASKEQRLSLLQGLMDTDGTCDKGGRCNFDNTNKNITYAVAHLLRSLGQRCRVSTKQGKLNGAEKKLVYRIAFTPYGIMPFRLARKMARCCGRKIKNQRSIIAVEPIESRPGKCIQVNSPNRLYLAGEDFIPTHNTFCDIYIGGRAALIFPNFHVYIILPELDQAEDIYWTSNRLPDFLPPEFVVLKSKSDLLVQLDNRSTISLHGAKNYEALRGSKPDLVIGDESQGHSKECHKEVIEPNLLGRGSSLILTGTPPPKKDCYYYEYKSQVIEGIKNGDQTSAYFEFPTSVNPIIDKDRLEFTRKRLYASGDSAIWKREYLGQDCFSGRNSIFPVFLPDTHVRPRFFLEKMFENDKHKLKWFTMADPGTTSCFAVLFFCYNPFTNQIYFLDEIYETDRRYNDSHQMWERIKAKEKALYQGKWKRVYDEAGAWFANEVKNNFRRDEPNWSPTKKRKNKIEDQISLIKILMSAPESFYIAAECKKFIWEIENYVTDEDGDFPEDNDHLVDLMRYGVSASSVKTVESLNEQSTYIVKNDNAEYTSTRQKIVTVSEDWAMRAQEDFNSGLEGHVSWEDW